MFQTITKRKRGRDTEGEREREKERKKERKTERERENAAGNSTPDTSTERFRNYCNSLIKVPTAI